MKCRHCGADVHLPFIDLGSSPPSNAFLEGGDLDIPEVWYPLKVLVCEQCWLVQTKDYAHAAHLFSPDYAYFSSYSSTWLAHAERYADEMTGRFGLTERSLVVEVASNDGYLLQYFQERGVPCLGIEPTASTASAAREKGLDIIEEFFGLKMASRLASQGRMADLMVANNVLAHVPDINDFVQGFARLLKPGGVATFEFPHLLKMVQGNQFDTIYHEHFSYISYIAVCCIFESNGLNIFDVEELPTHGGSLRVFAQRRDTLPYPVTENVANIRRKEHSAGIDSRDFYGGFQTRANKVKDDLVSFLIQAKREGKKVAAYGAAAKGNTLLNYAGIRPDLIAFVVDRNPAKQGEFLPGSRIPIVEEEALNREKPDFIVIFPWNLRQEIEEQLNYVRRWDGQFVIAVPELEIL